MSELPCKIAANVETTAGDVEIVLSISQGKRTVAVNGKPTLRASSFYGKLKAVVFTPEELLIIKGAPALRRQFIDRTISLVDPIYLDSLVSYHQALKNRNTLLKGIRVDSLTRDQKNQFDAWEAVLAAHNESIAKSREMFLAKIAPLAQNYYEQLMELSKNNERIGISLSSNIRKEDLSINSIEEIAEQLANSRLRDAVLQSTTVGVHRDDLEVSLDVGSLPRSARLAASQGQVRSISLALKFAAFSYIEQETGERPILLLDDVESELDERRKCSLYRLLSGLEAQVIISATELSPQLVAALPSFDLLRVAGGRIVQRGIE